MYNQIKISLNGMSNISYINGVRGYSSTTQKCQYLASLYVLFIEACLLESFALFGGSKMLAL